MGSSRGQSSPQSAQPVVKAHLGGDPLRARQKAVKTYKVLKKIYSLCAPSTNQTCYWHWSYRYWCKDWARVDWVNQSQSLLPARQARLPGVNLFSTLVSLVPGGVTCSNLNNDNNKKGKKGEIRKQSRSFDSTIGHLGWFSWQSLSQDILKAGDIDKTDFESGRVTKFAEAVTFLFPA